MHLHEGAIDRFAQAVASEQAVGRAGSPRQRPRRGAGESEFLHDARGESAETLALGAQPFLELGGHAIDAVQEVAAVQGGRPAAGTRLRRQARKVDGVDRDAVRQQRHRVAVGVHGIEARLPERLTDPGQRLLQAVARLRLGAIAPQQAGKAVAGLRLSGRQRADRRAAACPCGSAGSAPRRPRIPGQSPPTGSACTRPRKHPPAGEPQPRRRRFYPLFTLAGTAEWSGARAILRCGTGPLYGGRPISPSTPIAGANEGDGQCKGWLGKVAQADPEFAVARADDRVWREFEQ